MADTRGWVVYASGGEVVGIGNKNKKKSPLQKREDGNKKPHRLQRP